MPLVSLLVIDAHSYVDLNPKLSINCNNSTSVIACYHTVTSQLLFGFSLQDFVFQIKPTGLLTTSPFINSNFHHLLTMTKEKQPAQVYIEALYSN